MSQSSAKAANLDHCSVLTALEQSLDWLIDWLDSVKRRIGIISAM